MSLIELLLVGGARKAFHNGEKAREGWLSQRNVAERCRLVSFRTLMRRGVWETYEREPVPCEEEDQAEIKAIEAADFPAVEEWLEKDTIPPPPGRFYPANKDELLKLREYYLQKRIAIQKGHFTTRTSDAEIARDRAWRELPGALFWASVWFVLFHSALELGWLLVKRWIPNATVDGSIERILIGLVTLAALAPTLGAGIHSWRSAWEGTRNISRFRAKAIALANIEARLSKGKEILKDEDAEELMRDIWCAEQIMESEHREWLRLMKDAEWAG
jgi:hypothetical protein